MSREVVLSVLNRAAEDVEFFGQLVENPDAALRDYDLSWEEKAALTTGDVRWIESYIGRKLDERLMRNVMIPLLSREKW